MSLSEALQLKIVFTVAIHQTNLLFLNQSGSIKNLILTEILILFPICSTILLHRTKLTKTLYLVSPRQHLILLLQEAKKGKKKFCCLKNKKLDEAWNI